MAVLATRCVLATDTPHRQSGSTRRSPPHRREGHVSPMISALSAGRASSWKTCIG